MSQTFPQRGAAQPRPARFWLGFALGILGAVLFSAKAIVVKLIYMHGTDALAVIGLRMLYSLPFFAMIAWHQSRKASRGELPCLTRRECGQIIFLGLLGYYLSSYLDFIGLQYITASLERLILFLSPTFVLLISALFLKRPIAGRQWLAMAISYLGVMLVFLQDMSFSGKSVMLGSAFVLASALCYALYLIGSGELVKRVGATRLVAYAMSVSALAAMTHFFIAQGWEGLQQNAAVHWLSVLHAVVHTVVPTFMIMWSVAMVGAPMAAQLGLSGPIAVLFGAAWILGEPLTAVQLAGTVFVLGGMVLLGRR